MLFVIHVFHYSLHIVVVFTMNHRTNQYCKQAFLSAISVDYSKLNYVVSLKAAIQLIIGTILLWDSKSKLGPFLLGTAIIPVSSLLFGLSVNCVLQVHDISHKHRQYSR